MPKNVESYYQEAGRAGRDGAPADCVLLYSPKDVQINRFLIENQEANDNLIPVEQEAIRKNDLELLKFMTWYSTTTDCLRHYMLRYFGERNTPIYCGNCSNCNTHYDTVDITVDAQKIVSCVMRVERMGRIAGKSMIANILHGSKNTKIAQNRYDVLPTYGIMADTPVHRIMHTIDYMIQQGYLALSDDKYPVIRTNSKSSIALKGVTALSMKLPKERQTSATLTTPESKEAKAAPNPKYSALFSDLAALRRTLARQGNVPAYIIFSDATLRDMCFKMPQTEDEFLAVSGVGMTKLKRYGAAFLEVIRKYIDE